MFMTTIGSSMVIAMGTNLASFDVSSSLKLCTQHSCVYSATGLGFRSFGYVLTVCSFDRHVLQELQVCLCFLDLKPLPGSQ